MKRVAIIDYGMGNLGSVARAVEECGGQPIITRDASEIEAATHLILPGVGAFDMGMLNIRERGLDRMLAEQAIGKGIPLLGICLGMQVLARKGWEGAETEGLGWIDGEVKRLEPDGQRTRIPHVGWDEVFFTQASPLFEGIPSGKDFYFVHSYHLTCRRQQQVLGRTDYCGGFASVVGRERIFGVQFHPEKSQRVGLQVLKNFLAV